MEIREIFWTGGWDSTFRMVQLSRMSGIRVQPVYISGDNRPSEKIELVTMEKIITLLKNKLETTAEFLPLKVLDKKDIPENPAITQAYETIRKSIPLGTQYDFLARYAFGRPYIEMGAICPDGEFSGIRETIERFGGGELVPCGDSWILDQEHSTDECRLVFGCISFPIVKIKEREMQRLVNEWGYDDVMKEIWFCHHPINGKTCGFCRPCEQKIEGNMAFLVDKKGQRRYQNIKMVENLFGSFAKKCLMRIYRKLSF